MLDVHPPHHSPNTWRDFFIHIATIVVGLLIAVGLEQTVEYFHRAHQRRELDAQVLEVLQSDLTADSIDIRALTGFRSYLSDLRAALIARRGGKSVPAAPPQGDERMEMQTRFPSLAPYDAAKENGTVSVLPANEIRLFDRIALQRQLLLAQSTDWHRSTTAWQSFEQRFIDSKGSVSFGDVSVVPDLAQLSAAEIIEFQTLTASLITETDVLLRRLHYFDNEARDILSGDRDELGLFNAIIKKPRGNAQGRPTP